MEFNNRLLLKIIELVSQLSLYLPPSFFYSSTFQVVCVFCLCALCVQFESCAESFQTLLLLLLLFFFFYNSIQPNFCCCCFVLLPWNNRFSLWHRLVFFGHDFILLRIFFSKLRFVLVSLALLPFVRYSIPHCVVHKCVLRRRLLIPAVYDVINYVRFLRPGRKQETPLKTIVRNNDK